ncbi:hypothetical protein AMECASPLE_025885 [Ameca splendens]|uniref:Uncharacterized protein n=1 Tax=Ameca splendens TaxID=208324 RepID=A0ABV0ZDN2_9TELE
MVIRLKPPGQSVVFFPSSITPSEGQRSLRETGQGYTKWGNVLRRQSRRRLGGEWRYSYNGSLDISPSDYQPHSSHTHLRDQVMDWLRKLSHLSCFLAHLESY